MHRSRSIPAALSALLLAGAAAGQQPTGDEEGPLILTSRPNWEWFKFTPVRGYLELEARHQVDRQESRGTRGITDRENLLRETVNLETDGYIGRPEFLKIDASGGLNFTQSNLDSESINRSGEEAELGNQYNLRARFFDESRMPFSLYTMRNQDLVDRLFAGTIDSTTTEHGAALQFRSESVPTSLRYFHREQDENDQFGDLDYSLKQDTFQADSEWNISDGQRLETDYTFDDITENLAQGISTSFQRHDLSLTHTLDFGQDRRSSLRSTGRYFRQLGDNAEERARLDESLRLSHNDHFETHYDASIERLVEGDDRQDVLAAALGARYQLFDSLTASGNLGGSMLDASGATTDTVFGDGLLRYVKLVPYGQIDAGLGLAGSRQDEGARGDPRNIDNEPHVFNDPEPIVIIRRNIIASSVRVTDAADIRIYIRGLDYTVRGFPDRVEIRRVLGGAIADGQTVLIDYTIGPEPASTVDTRTGLATVRYTVMEGRLTGVSVYANYRNTDQEQVAGVPQEGLLNDEEVVILGADYRMGPFTLNAEHEEHSSDILPFSALRLSARYDQGFGRTSELSLGVTHESVSYRDPNNEVRLDRVYGLWVQELGEHMQLEFRGIYRDEHDDLLGDLRGLDAAIELRWWRRQTEITASVRNSIIDSDQGDSTFQSVWLTLRRNF